jgi:hypothetical protein
MLITERKSHLFLIKFSIDCEQLDKSEFEGVMVGEFCER